MEQWQYKIAFIEAGGMGYYRLREADERGMIGNGQPVPFVDALNQYGADGWELAGIGGGLGRDIVVFKRRKP